MQETNNNIGFIENITSKVLRLAGNANSNEVIIGFVLSGVEKLNKINSVLKRLYPLVNEYNDVEFSVGILLRSLMMDSIQTQYLASLIEKNLNESKAKIIDELSHCCLKFMTDSTGFILNEILDNDSLSTKQKENNKENILRQFRNLQLNSIGKLSIKSLSFRSSPKRQRPPNLKQTSSGDT